MMWYAASKSCSSRQTRKSQTLATSSVGTILHTGSRPRHHQQKTSRTATLKIQNLPPRQNPPLRRLHQIIYPVWNLGRSKSVLCKIRSNNLGRDAGQLVRGVGEDYPGASTYYKVEHSPQSKGKGNRVFHCPSSKPQSPSRHRLKHLRRRR